MVEDTHPEVTTVQRGDLVVAPFASSDTTCPFSRGYLYTSCAHAQAGSGTARRKRAEEGGQAEAIRVPLVGGTPVKLSSRRTPPSSRHC
ncbi:alcohol dehydrogenase catalytic domain-containing protein [Streptomyces sp. NPDC005389]|uniref:alcohol dehydrogenase catalytic domain-containing protein n=1 Tax=Streptomyces sp. NPDC005389 TaxID=3157040 RepID=UPI0033AC26C5